MAELTRIHSTDSPDAIDVVFVHGLGGDMRATWMRDANDETTLWPAWVGEDANCNVWLLGYGAALSGWMDGAMHLVDLGVDFMSALLYEPELRKRPLLLVGHSLGGLVIKSGIARALTLDDPRFRPVIDTIRGVVFVGTPHQGSDLATVAAALSPVLRTNPQVVNMAADDAWMKDLNGQFRKFQADLGFQVRVFFETKGVLAGRNFFGLSLGPRVVIVDRNSSDPQIPRVVPTPIHADHIHIAKPANRNATIHRALLTLVGELRPLMQAEPVADASAPRPSEANDLRERLYDASRPLLSWPTAIPGGIWLDRPELEQLAASCSAATSSVTLLLGEAGSGKSALLARLVKAKHADGWPALAIKADRLPENITDDASLARFLAIDGSIATAIGELARTQPVLVVVDQLDALADLVVQHSARLRVLLDLIAQLADTPNVHVVASCRIFEQRHDPSLRNLDATPVMLQLPEWDAVRAVLHDRGLHADGWNDDLKQVLRSPHALDVFIGLLADATEVGVLSSFHGMLELQWRKHVAGDGTGRRKQAMYEIAQRMAERETLGLPLAAVDQWMREIEQLTAAGLLRVDPRPGRVEFRHQTLYEFVRARSFLDAAGRLTETVLRHQESLRIRPQLWHALAYLRNASPEGYSEELERLWTSDVRRHLRMLITEFLGRQESPLPAEKRIVFRSLADPWFKPRFLSAAAGSPGWLDALAKTGHLNAFMSLPVPEARIVVPYLARALGVDAALVAGLVRRIWLPDPARDDLSWRVLALSNVAPQSAEWVRDLETITARTRLSEWDLQHAASVVSTVMPDAAPRLVAAGLKREIASILSKHTNPEGEPGSDAVRELRSLLDTREYYDLPAIAEAAPQAFVTAMWPLYAQGLRACAEEEHGFLNRYPSCPFLAIDGIDDENRRSDHPLHEAVRIAIQGWADADAASFLDFVEANAVPVLVAERLFAKGAERCAAAEPARVLAYLRNDSRRLTLGPYPDVHKDSVAVIHAVSMHLDDRQFAELETLIVRWNRYKASPPGEDASTRRQMTSWTREHRLLLFRALPRDRCSVALRNRIEQEERAFPELANESDDGGGLLQTIGRPVTAEQMAKAADDDIVNLFDELVDRSGWSHPRHAMRGGAIQAGRALAELAKKDFRKVLRIVRSMKPDVNEIPAGTVLSDLVAGGCPPSELFALVEDLHAKGFVSAGFRQHVAAALDAVITSDTPLPDSLFALVESWLAPSTHEQNVKLTDKKTGGSILWSGETLRSVPSGNYVFLSLLSRACLATRPIQADRWLDVLARHLKRLDVQATWQAMTWRRLPALEHVDHPRAEAFLDELFDAFPQLLASHDGIRLLANTYRWASPDSVRRWLDRTGRVAGNAQGLGELALLRHAMFPSETWARNAVVTALDAKGAEATTRRAGIAYAVRRLWKEATMRAVVQPYLLQLVASVEDDVLVALGTIFRGDGFAPDTPTYEFLDALVAHPRLLAQPGADHLPEILETLVTVEPERVCAVANRILDVAAEAIGDLSTSWSLSAESLMAIAFRLQDLGKNHRRAGSALFERMLEFNLPQAYELTLDLDKRTPIRSTPARRARRRRRTK